MKVGGLFSGIGGWELGLQRAGFEIAWHCEADEFCRRVLERHWPGVPCYPDVTTLSGGMVESVDVLCGGFPCQDVSDAGARAGIDGARSGLWDEFARLIGEIRPRYVLVENVAALARRGLSRALADLAEFGMDAEWTALRASDFGAPHPRDRLWLVAYAPSGTREPRDCLGSGEEWRPSGEPTGVPSLAMAPGWQPRGFWRDAEPPTPLLDDGVSRRVDELTALGNALVPQIAEWIGRRILAYEGLA